MDDVRLAEILDRVSKATPGPWGVWTSMDNTLDVLSELEHPYTPIISFYGDSGEHPSERENRDADFVAHARTDVPDLLIALTEARAEIERLTAAGIDPSAEKALKTSAEAYRLVEEARQMRAERDQWEDIAHDLTERLFQEGMALIDARAALSTVQAERDRLRRAIEESVENAGRSYEGDLVTDVEPLKAVLRTDSEVR